MKAVPFSFVLFLVLFSVTSEARLFGRLRGGGFFRRGGIFAPRARGRIVRRAPQRVFRQEPQRIVVRVDEDGHAIGDNRNRVVVNGGGLVDPSAGVTPDLTNDVIAGRPIDPNVPITSQAGEFNPAIAQDGSYRSFMQKLHAFQCRNPFKSVIWRTVEDPDDPQFNLGRVSLPGAHQIMDNLETLRREGIVPQDVNFGVQRENTPGKRKNIELKQESPTYPIVRIYADNPPSLQQMRTFFLGLGTGTRSPRLSNDELEVRDLKCSVLFGTGIYGGIAADGNIESNPAVQKKILTVLKQMADQGFRARRPINFFYFSDTVTQARFFDPEGQTLLINPNFTANDIIQHFTRSR